MFLKIVVDKIILGCVYIPPDASNEMCSERCEVIESIHLKLSDFYLDITGGFNLNNYVCLLYDSDNQSHISGDVLLSHINFFNLKHRNSINNSNGRTLV